MAGSRTALCSDDGVGMMCFFFHDWTKWDEPYERIGFYGKWQDRQCRRCGKIETRLT